MSPYPIKLYHRWGNFLLWGILADIGIVFAQYKKCKRRTDIHGNIMSFLVINSFLSALAYCYLKPQNYEYENYIQLNEYKQDHLIIGTTLMILMVFMSIFGYFIKLQLKNPEASNNLIFYKKMHTIGGHLIYFVGKYESFLGMYMSYRNEDWFIFIWLTYLGILIWRVVLQFILPFFNKSTVYSILQENNNVSYENLTTDLVNKTWCIFKDQIFIMKDDYIHPGGQLIWKHLNQIEIGQYFYGITQLPGTNILHYHSSDAFKQLFDCRYGTLVNTLGFPQSDITRWDLKKSIKVTDNVTKFDFSHPTIEFEVNLTKIIPNHFVLKSIKFGNVRTRLYTFIQCLQKPSLEYMERVGELFDKKENIRLSTNFRSAILSLYIKFYDAPNGFSKYITKYQPESVDLQGPYQTVLHNYLLQGQIILICGGTGILPFLDLLNYHLLMTYNQLLKHPNVIKVPVINRYITLFYSIATEEEMIGEHIYLRLRELQQYLDAQNFTLILKCRKPTEKCDTVKNRFTKEFLQRFFRECEKQIFVCGPPVMRNSIVKELSDQQIQIVYL